MPRSVWIGGMEKPVDAPRTETLWLWTSSELPSPFSPALRRLFLHPCSLCSAGPKSDLRFPVRGTRSSPTACTACRRPGRIFNANGLEPCHRPAGRAGLGRWVPRSPPPPLLCLSAFSSALWPHLSELLSDPPVTPPQHTSSPSSRSGAGTVFSDPNWRRRGGVARIANESFDCGGVDESKPHLQRQPEARITLGRLEPWFPVCCWRYTHQCPALADIRRCKSAGRGSWLGSL